MKRAIVFANGIMHNWPIGLELSNNYDLIIAADGGLNHCRHWGITPQIIIGDMDSVGEKELLLFERQGVVILRFPARKDETDLELALQTALRHHFEEVVILGALGARWDMTLSNVMILAAPFLKGVSVRILDDDHEIVCLHDGGTMQFKEKFGDTVSLIPLSNAVEVTLEGFEYPLQNEALLRGTTRSISNVIKEPFAYIKVAEGQLIVVHIYLNPKAV